MIDDRRRRTAVGLGVLGAVGIVVAVAGAGLGTYVSEAGVAGNDHSALYRVSVLVIALTAALVASMRLPRLTKIALAAAAPAIALSGAVTCTEGCPLPPYEPTTPADLVHAAGSIAGVGLCALAMLTLLMRGRGGVRMVSLIAVAVGWPLMLGTAIGMVAVGRGLYTGVMERLALTVCLLWLLAVAGLKEHEREHPAPAEP